MVGRRYFGGVTVTSNLGKTATKERKKKKHNENKIKRRDPQSICMKITVYVVSIIFLYYNIRPESLEIQTLGLLQ